MHTQMHPSYMLMCITKPNIYINKDLLYIYSSHIAEGMKLVLYLFHFNMGTLMLLEEGRNIKVMSKEYPSSRTIFLQ